MSIEERVKTLEDLVQALARCFIAPPTPAPTQQAKFPAQAAYNKIPEKTQQHG